MPAGEEIWFAQARDPLRGDGCRIFELAHEVKARLGLKPIILTASSNSRLDTALQQDVRLERVAPEFSFPWGNLLYTLALCREIRRRHSAVAAIHINSPAPESALLVRAAKRYGIRSVIQMTLIGSDDPQTLVQFRRYTRPVARMFVRRLGDADAILGLSRALTERALSFGWPPSKVRCSSVAKDPNLFRPPRTATEKIALRDKLGIPRETVVAAYVGYLSRRKGTDLLIQAWAQITREIPGVFLLLAGDYGKSGEITRNSLEALPWHSYRHYGAVTRAEVAELLRASDLFVFPTRREGFGAALLEAVMSGLPAVTSNLPGITDMMVEHGINGFLCNPGESAQLISELLRLIGSPRLRQEMGTRSLEVAGRFHPDVIWPTYRWAYTGQ